MANVFVHVERLHIGIEDDYQRGPLARLHRWRGVCLLFKASLAVPSFFFLVTWTVPLFRVSVTLTAISRKENWNLIHVVCGT
jgi:hypothetical protein